jgi:hypothetical protein
MRSLLSLSPCCLWRVGEAAVYAPSREQESTFSTALFQRPSVAGDAEILQARMPTQPDSDGAGELLAL